MIRRGEIYWVDLGSPKRSRPAKRRPLLIVQSDTFNASRLNTVLGAVITSNTDLAAMPGNVFLPAAASGLPRDSVVNVSAVVTVDKSEIEGPTGHAPASLLHAVDRGLKQVLDL